MVAPWRFSLRVCLSCLKGSELRTGLLRLSGCSRNARLCWLLLGTLPKLISTYEDTSEGTPDSLCQRRARWSGLAGSGPVERASVAGRLGWVSLHLRIWLRAGVLLVKFFPLLLLYPLTYLTPGVSALWLHLLLKATETSGPTYIKLGQWASTRRDLFSEEFCARFSKLHVRVTPHSWTHTERFLRQAFGEDWGCVLSFEDQEPVGSGCVAQVYKAHANLAGLGSGSSTQGKGRASRLQPSEAGESWGLRELFEHPGKAWNTPGNLADQSFLEKLLLPKAGLSESNVVMSQASASGHHTQPGHLIPVAVKVLHPGLLAQVHMDLMLMKLGSRILGLLPGVKWLSLPEIVDEFEKLMVQQIDLRYEARNLEHFQHNFRNVKSVRFPTPLHPFVTRDVLVETYEIFVDNFVHADLHPGNILVQGADGLPRSREAQLQQVDVCDTLVVAVTPALRPLRLVLLDAGIVAELQAADLRNFRAVFMAVVMGQGQRVAELILQHARASQCRDVEGFKAEMAALVSQARKNTITLEKVKLESNFASIVFAIMVLEGLGRSLDPKLDILEAAKPFLLTGPVSMP
ncbi:Putative aarF domain-containing protein kinase 2 [Tupaia chinensis]|uniref:Putative aarF domain-containing protein kinase 2 n=1 Tax=Tupaia chinensis TaxID=246437 RepID=L9L0V0_TUPCH|nr:Putative aarF domain-containing protein kinase 2 [Tupaia chinensis]